MSAARDAPARIPVGPIAANLVGVVLMGAGAIGLLAPDLTAAVPALGNPATVWTLIGAGLAIEFGSMLTLVRHAQRLRQAAGHDRPAPAGADRRG